MPILASKSVHIDIKCLLLVVQLKIQFDYTSTSYKIHINMNFGIKKR